MPRKMTNEEFISRSISKHGDKYDYSKTLYLSSDKKVSIICRKHGEFKQRASDHIRGCGCQECKGVAKSNNDKFVKKATILHNNKYNYEKVIYKNNREKVSIICPYHGEFKQSPNHHLRGEGCRKCNDEKIRLSREEFIKRSIEKHGNKYDYSEVVYKGRHFKVFIICPIHGKFSQFAESHITGSGCLKCVNDRDRLKKEFVKKANNIHNNKYRYEKVIYTYSNKSVVVSCTLHGDFNISPSKHLLGKGCPVCKKTNDFICKAMCVHGDKYCYQKTICKNKSGKVIIRCKKHGEFKQRVYSHLLGNGCSKCSGKIKKTLPQFIEQAIEMHGNKYNYEKSVYISAHKKLIIICPVHGEFKQDPHSHLKGNGCHKCNSSKGETAIEKFLKLKNVKYESQCRFESCKNKSYLIFDFIINYNNKICAIEYQGEQHYRPVPFNGSKEKSKELHISTVKNDLIKKKWCKNNNIHFLEIPYWNYEKIEELISLFLEKIS